jgi:hypothetical protein
MRLLIPCLSGTKQPVVNLKELGIVRQQHMPSHVIKFAPAEELERVAGEVSRQHPHLVEEAHFVKYEELGRRERLAGSPLVAEKGGRYHG